LPDKNLFEASVPSADGALLAPQTFGLGGARQWLVYGPYKLWLDGELVGESRRVQGWAPHEDEGLECILTGWPQRLLVKFVRWTDAMAWSALFIGPGDPEGKRGVSYILDCLEDLPARVFGSPGTAKG
jgi:hypothetical protein